MAICQPQNFLDRQKIVYERNQAYEKKVVVGFRKIQSGEQPYLPDFPDFSGLLQKYISASVEFKLAVPLQMEIFVPMLAEILGRA